MAENPSMRRVIIVLVAAAALTLGGCAAKQPKPAPPAPGETSEPAQGAGAGTASTAAANPDDEAMGPQAGLLATRLVYFDFDSAGARRGGLGEEPTGRDRVPDTAAAGEAVSARPVSARGPSMRLIVLAVPLALLAAGCASTPPEPDPVQLKLNDLDARIARIETNQVEAAQRMDEVQARMRELRGRIEELEHNNEALAKQQRELYADLDKRLAAASAARSAAPGAAGDGAATAGATTGGATAGSGAGAAPEGGGTAPAMGAGGAGAAAPGAASSTEQAVYAQAFDA